MQHIYAFVFSSSVTTLLASVILYVDYGFWHEKYERTEPVVIQKEEIVTKSPFEMFSDFLGEARDRFNTMESSSASFLQGKEVYTRQEFEAESTREETSGDASVSAE